MITHPINDIVAITDRLKITSLMSEIENYLERNKTNEYLSQKCCQTTLQTLISVRFLLNFII